MMSYIDLVKINLIQYICKNINEKERTSCKSNERTLEACLNDQSGVDMLI